MNQQRLRVTLIIAVTILSVISISSAETEIAEGYDENTEITIKGNIIEIIQGMRGPVILKLSTGIKTYKIATAPPWYLLRNSIVFEKDTLIEVTGSRYFAKDGNLYIIARQVRNPVTGETTFFRDSSCRPLWRGHKMPRRFIP